jgi:hypothetical protein
MLKNYKLLKMEIKIGRKMRRKEPILRLSKKSTSNSSKMKKITIIKLKLSVSRLLTAS